MVSETDEGRMHEEVERLFVPSAQRMVAATETFVQTWREMRTVERVFATVLNIAHQSVYGDHYQMRYECELVGERHQGQLLPSLIHGVEFDVVDKLNRGFDDLDDDLLQRLWSKLNEAGIERHNLKVIHPGSENDRRNIYAPEGKGPAKRPEYVHGGHVQIV
jgi:hypothetical protein